MRQTLFLEEQANAINFQESSQDAELWSRGGLK